MKKSIFYFFVFFSTSFFAQVGINTTTPNAQLDIRSSNQVAPASTDGMLIPKIDTFPALNPTVAQQGMLVYLTSNVGSNQPGFYYWDNITTSWIPMKSNDTGTLDQAYDFGGAGNGRMITADAGAVIIDGTDGLVSTGTLNSGAVTPSGAGTKMIWNPRKAAFRAGRVTFDQWDDINVGSRSIGFGENTTSSGIISTAFGFGTTASGSFSTVFGQNNVASGQNSFAFGFASTASGVGSAVFGNFNLASGSLSLAYGINTIASGGLSTALGRVTTASGDNSFVLGINNTARSFGETVIGVGATNYIPSTNGATQFRTANTSDRLFVIGNAIDTNNSGFVDVAERRDAMIVLKNGLTRLPSTTNTMIDAADGKSVVTKEYLQTNTSGTLDQAYDFGGAGLGRTITADAGSVTIAGNDGLVSTGTLGVGALVPSQLGPQMIWYPRKAAFRAGQLTSVGGQWNDSRIGISSVAFGDSTEAFGEGAAAFGIDTYASGDYSFAHGDSSLATGDYSAAFGDLSIAEGNYSFAFGRLARAFGNHSICFGNSSTASGAFSTAFGGVTTAAGTFSTVSGRQNSANSFGETVIGIGSTTYTPSANGATQFRATNSSDRLFVIGNAIDANSNDVVDTVERSDAMVVLKNGNTGIGNSTPSEKLHVAGRALFTNGFSADNAALIYRNNTDYMFLGPQSGSSANGGAMALYGSTNVSGGNAGGVNFNVPNGQLRVNHTNGNYIFRANSTSGYDATFELNDVGLQMGHNSNSRAIVLNTASTERFRVTAAGNVGIATTNPSQRFDVGVGNIAVSQGDIYLGAAAGVFNAGGGLMTGTINYIGDAFVAPTLVNGDEDLYIADDLELGSQGYKPGGGLWVAPSDRRLKQNIQPFSDGLESLLKINPVTYQYNNIFKTLDTGETYVGIIAQEVQQIAPYMIDEKPFGQVVEEDESGNEKIIDEGIPYLTFDGSALTYMLINAVKEINSKYEELKTKNEALENKLNELLIRIEKIENN